MADPAHDARLEIGQFVAARRIGTRHTPQLAGEAVAVVVTQSAMAGEDPIAQDIQTVAGRRQMALAWMQRQTQLLQFGVDGVAPRP